MSSYGFGGGYGDALIKSNKTLPKWRPPVTGPSGASSDPAASDAGAGGGGGGGGGGANVNPWYAQLESMYRAQGAAEAAGMRSSIQQMLIGLGLVPSSFKDKFGSLDDVTRQLIEKNTNTGISTLARLNEQKKLGITNTIRDLNSRGMRRSGSRGYRLRRNQLGYDRNLADTMSQFMGQVGNMYNQYTQSEYGRQAALMQAAMQYYTGSSGSAYNNPYSGGGGSSGGGGGGYQPSSTWAGANDSFAITNPIGGKPTYF